MADEKLFRKLNVKPATGINILNAPDQLQNRLRADFPTSSATIQFVYSAAEVEHELPSLIHSYQDNHSLWIAFPKKSSRIKTDLSRDNGWEMLSTLGFHHVTLISIDDDWSAFRIRPVSASAPSIRRDRSLPRPDLIAPPALADELANSREAKAVFEKLSYSHRKEYIVWIEQAKRPETRQKRVESTIERLLAISTNKTT